MENNMKVYIYMYIYIKLNHFAVHQKLIQYCKSTLLQFRRRDIGVGESAVLFQFIGPKLLTSIFYIFMP